MVESIHSFGPLQGPGSLPAPKALTDEEQSQIQTILSRYDKDDFTAEDTKAIFQSFREAGIQPGPGMKEAISAAGFDAEKLRSMGLPEGGHPPLGGGLGKGIDRTTLQSLQNILSQFDLTSLSDDQESELLTKLTEAGLMRSGSLIDLSA